MAGKDQTTEEKKEPERSEKETRFRVELSPLERKALITLAVSGEAESIDELSDSTGLDKAELESVLSGLASKGVVARVEEASPAPQQEKEIAEKAKEEEGEAEELEEDIIGEDEMQAMNRAARKEPCREAVDSTGLSDIPEGVMYAEQPEAEEREEKQGAEAGPEPMDQPARQAPEEAAEPEEKEERPAHLSGKFRMEPESLSAILESLAGMNYYQMLGLPPSASRDDMREVYYDLVMLFHPDSQREIEDPEVKTLLADIFSTLTLAYETLRGKKSRRNYDRTIPEFTGVLDTEDDEALDALFGDSGEGEYEEDDMQNGKPPGWSFYEAGLEDFKVGNYTDADMNFKLALGLEPDRAEYLEAARKVKTILDARTVEDLKKRAARLEGERRFKEAVAALSKAASLHPDDPELFYNMGRIRFLKTMERELSERNVEKAVNLDPGHVEALLLYGRVLAWRGHREAAVKAFEKVLQLEPEHDKAKQALELFAPAESE